MKKKATIPEKTATGNANRRAFLRTLIGAGGVAALGATPVGKLLEREATNDLFSIAQQAIDDAETDEHADALTRMKAELVRALQKPADQRRWVTVIDLRKCVGCHACATACPYSARTADFGFTYTEGTPIASGIIMSQQTADEYERTSNFEYGKSYDRPEGRASSPIGNARKCHFYQHRVKA